MKRYLVLLLLLFTQTCYGFGLWDTASFVGGGNYTVPYLHSLLAGNTTLNRGTGTATYTGSSRYAETYTGNIFETGLNNPVFNNINFSTSAIDGAVLTEKTDPINITAGWTASAVTVNSANSYTLTGASGQVFKALLTPGKLYTATFNGTKSAGTLQLRGGNTGVAYALPGETVTFISQDTNLGIYLSVGGIGATATNLSLTLKEVAPTWVTTDRPVSCWGDSFTFGFGGTSYPTQLKWLLPDMSFYNMGVSTELSTQIKDRFVLEPNRHNHVSIIWAGANDYNAPNTVKANIAEMVSMTNGKYIVLSVILSAAYATGSPQHTQVLTLNSDLSTLYGDKYIDVRTLLVNSYDEGIPQDVTDFSNDVVPTSLRSDVLHLNAVGYGLVAGWVYAKMVEQGFTSHSIIAANGKGFLSEPETTNLSIQSSTAGTSWTASNITVTSNVAIGPDNTATADTIAATANDATLSQTTTQALDTKTWALWLKRKTGTGTVSLSLDGGATYNPINVTKIWSRFYITQAIVNAHIKLKISTSGDALFFYGSNLVAGIPTPTTYIATTTAAVSSTATKLSYPTAGHFTSSKTGSISFYWTPLGYKDATDYYLFSSRVDDANLTAIIHNSGNIIFRKRVAGTNYDATLAIGNPVVNQTYKIDAYILNDNTTYIKVDGAPAVIQANTTQAQIGDNMEIGSLNGASNTYAYIRDFKTSRR